MGDDLLTSHRGAQGPRLALLLSVLLALVGALLSAELTVAHLSHGAEGLLALDCTDAGGDCSRVLASRWATFPPADPADLVEGQRAPGVPVAALGLVYFTTLATWLALVGLCRGKRAHWNTRLLQVLGAGCLLSGLYVGLMVSQLDALCTLCLATHGAHFALLACVVLAMRATPRDVNAPSEGSAHPAPRLAVAAMLLGPCLGALAWTSFAAHASSEATLAVEQRLEVLDHKAGLVELAWFSDTRFSADESGRARFDASLRADDPELPGGEGAIMTLVIFSDAECPSCGRFEAQLTDEILPLFAGHLRVVYKHFPLASHDHAEEAARALEAARLQGAFWGYKALLDPRRQRLQEVDHAALAQSLGLDVARFGSDWFSSAVVLRVAEDVSSGQALGVDGTPTVFLDRRLVDPLTRGLTGFWARRAQVLRDAREARDQEW